MKGGIPLPEQGSVEDPAARSLRAVPADHLVETWRPPFPIDLGLTLAPLRHGPFDPTHRFAADGIWRATRTPDGPATMHLRRRGDAVLANAWGPGAERAVDALPRLLGVEDRPEDLRPAVPWLRELAARFAGARFGRTDAVLESLLPAVVEQKVTGTEAHRAWRGLVLRFGDRAPGPGGLWLAPEPGRLRRIPLADLHPPGLEERRALTLRRVADAARALEAALGLPAPDALARLQAVPGVGPWTAAEALRAATGDPDMLSLGDFHMPHLVAWALAREARGSDERMLELLEPYRGQRARVVRLLELAGVRAPRFGPRMAPRDIRGL